MSDTDPKCAKCGKRRSEHNYRHPFVGPSRDDTINALSDRIAELEAKLTKAALSLGALLDLNDNGGPFGGEIYQDRVERAWDTARNALADIKGKNT